MLIQYCTDFATNVAVYHIITVAEYTRLFGLTYCKAREMRQF